MLTGSMGNTIPVGSLVVDRSVPAQSLNVGDIVSFQKPVGVRGIDTHRIAAIRRSNGHATYRTKGDANSSIDPWTIEFARGATANRVVVSIPHVGHVLLVLQRPLARMAMLATALLLLFSTFLKALASEPRRCARDARDPADQDDFEEAFARAG